MCRDRNHGGRRCPSESDPVKIAARNARRRAKYAAMKAAKKQEKEPETKGTKTSVADVLNQGNEPFGAQAQSSKTSGNSSTSSPYSTGYVEGGITETLKGTESKEPPVPMPPVPAPPKHKKKGVPAKTEEEKKQEEGSENKLGFHREKNGRKSQQTTLGYFQGEKLVGELRYDQLDDDSHKEFGFSGDALRDKQPDWTMLQHMDAWSRMELKDMTKSEKESLTFFTSNDYTWFNDVLYHEKKPSNDWEREQVEKHTAAMDSAMAKGPKRQRIVYRGIRNTSGMFKGKNIHKWIDEKASRGSEISFDGYTSSTPDIGTAKSYSGWNNSGLVMEILTPEGLNVEHISEYSHEHEVILPREQHYIVVGVQKHNNGGATIQLVGVNKKGEILDGTNSDEPEPLDFDKEKKD